MFKERRFINFEVLEPRGKKKKRDRSDFFEWKLEVPGRDVESLEKPKNISEHKEILEPKVLPKVIPKPPEDEENANKVLEELDYLDKKCLKCQSDNLEIKENEDSKKIEFKCLNCGQFWEEQINN